MTPSGRQGQRSLNVPYQASRPVRPPKKDRMEDLRQCWIRPACKFICLGITVLLIAAILFIVYFAFWNKENSPYGYENIYRKGQINQQQSNNPYFNRNSYNNNPSINSQSNPNLQNLLNQPRSGDLSEQNRQNQRYGLSQQYQQPQHYSSSNYQPDNNQQHMPFSNPNNQQFNNKNINPQQQNSMQPYSYQYNSNQQQGGMNANSQPLSSLLGQSNTEPKVPINDPAYNRGPQVWPNAGFDPINLLGAQQQSGADGVGMRHPSSFINNGMERQYGNQQGNNAEYQNRGTNFGKRK